MCMYTKLDNLSKNSPTDIVEMQCIKLHTSCTRKASFFYEFEEFL